MVPLIFRPHATHLNQPMLDQATARGTAGPIDTGIQALVVAMVR